MVVLFVLLTIILAISIDYLIMLRRASVTKNITVVNQIRAFVPPAIFLNSNHTWYELTSAGSVNVGVDSIVAKILGTIDQVKYPQVGQKIKKGDTLLVLKPGDKCLEISASNDCVVDSINNLSPNQVCDNPYVWLCRIVPQDLEQCIKQSYIGAGARDWISNELSRLRDVVVELVQVKAPTMADGGAPEIGFVKNLNNDQWKALVQKFFVR